MVGLPCDLQFSFSPSGGPTVTSNNQPHRPDPSGRCQSSRDALRGVAAADRLGGSLHNRFPARWATTRICCCGGAEPGMLSAGAGRLDGRDSRHRAAPDSGLIRHRSDRLAATRPEKPLDGRPDGFCAGGRKGRAAEFPEDLKIPPPPQPWHGLRQRMQKLLCIRGRNGHD